MEEPAEKGMQNKLQGRKAEQPFGGVNLSNLKAQPTDKNDHGIVRLKRNLLRIQI